MCATPGSNTYAAIRLKQANHFRGGSCTSPASSTGGNKNDCVHGVFDGGCRCRHGDTRLVVAMTEPKTVPEMLDAAQTGEEFGNVILGIFKTLERLQDDE